MTNKYNRSKLHLLAERKKQVNLKKGNKRKPQKLREKTLRYEHNDHPQEQNHVDAHSYYQERELLMNFLKIKRIK